MRSLISRKGSLLNPDLEPVAVTCVAWVLLAFLIDPRGDFPLNDDWAFGLPVKALVEHGSVRFTEWTCPSLITQMGWGRVFCLPGGFSFTALRLSTLTLGLVALVTQYFLLRRVGASPAVALVGTWALGANPIFFSLSYTFMTDVPFLGLINLAVFFLFRGLDRGRDGDLWAGLLLALLAMFIRQIALGIFVGFLVAYPFWRGIGRRWALQAVLPTVLALVALKAYEGILKAIERLPLNYYQYNLLLADSLNDLAHMRLGVLKFAFLRACRILLYLGLIGAPFSLLLWPSWLARQSPRGRVVHLARVGGLTAVVTLALAWTGNLIPLLDPGSMLSDLGLGVRTLSGPWPPGAPRGVWVAVTGLAVLGTVLALRALVEVSRTLGSPPGDTAAAARRSRVIFMIVTCLFYAGPLTFAYMGLYDRYVLVWVPFALILIWEGLGRGVAPADTPLPLRLHPLGFASALVATGVFLVFDVAGTHDYLAWNRARWAAGVSLIRDSHVPPEEVDGGFEFNNYFRNLERIHLSRAERYATLPPDQRGSFIAPTPVDPPFRIAVGGLSGYEIIHHYPVSAWLPLAPREVVALKRLGPPSTAE